MDTSIKEIKRKFFSLYTNKKIKEIFKEINNHYSSMNFVEKRNLFNKFNDILNEISNNKAILYVNKNNQYNNLQVEASDDNDRIIIINGFRGNPYEYLKDILFYHFTFIDACLYDYIQIGDVYFNGNYTYVYPKTATYNSFNLENKKYACNIIKMCIDKNHNNKYIKEFLQSFDNNINKEQAKEFIKANKILDNSLKCCLFYELREIENLSYELVNGVVYNKKKLAALSIDNILHQAIINIQNPNQQINLLINLNNFISSYFPEYETYLHFKIIKKKLYLNDHVISMSDLFMDELFKTIEKIDITTAISEGLFSADKLVNINKALNRSMNKLEIYFYLKLIILDDNLKDCNYDLVNYVPFTHIFRFNEDEDIYKDKRRVFDSLLDSKEFIDLVKKLLNNKITNSNTIKQKKNIDRELLMAIMDQLNNVYDANFELIMDDNYQIDESFGTSYDNKIYLSSIENKSGICLLASLFHEYRHLIQNKEINNNTNIFSNELYRNLVIENKGYSESISCGYINDMSYGIQPSEFDAENFSKHMMTGIAKKLNLNVNNSEYNFNYYFDRKFKYFSNKKMSTEIYKNYLNIFDIEEFSNQRDCLCDSLSNEIKPINEDNVSIIFKENYFDYLNSDDKIKAYNKILINKSAMENVDDNLIKINNKKFELIKSDEYEILQEIIENNAIFLFKEKKLTKDDISEYIYHESLKYKCDIEYIDLYSVDKLYNYYNSFKDYVIRHRIKEEKMVKHNKNTRAK